MESAENHLKINSELAKQFNFVIEINSFSLYNEREIIQYIIYPFISVNS